MVLKSLKTPDSQETAPAGRDKFSRKIQIHRTNLFLILAMYTNT